LKVIGEWCHKSYQDESDKCTQDVQGDIKVLQGIWGEEESRE